MFAKTPIRIAPVVFYVFFVILLAALGEFLRL